LQNYKLISCSRTSTTYASSAQAFAPATNLNEEEPDDLPFNSKAKHK
jgi:hypothetical protein